LQAQPQAIDGGKCNGRLFLNGVGIGFDGAIVKDLEGKKKVAGKATYLLSILKNIFTYKEKYCQLALDNETLAQDCFMISVANGSRYGGSFQVAPKASVKDALLDVMVVGRIAAASRIRYLPVIEKGEHIHLSFIQYRHSTHITIQSEKPLPAHIDGEFICTSFFQIECLPKRFSFLL
jgi:diacylglycerol kinase family enzyme